MNAAQHPVWIAGIDVGGTFTDLIAIDTATGAVRLAKVPTTPQNQAFGVLAIAREIWPNRYVTAGHLILSEYREYERGVTAAVNASVQPILDRYIRRLVDELKARGFARDLLVMQGNGGTVAAALVAETAVNTVMSGPASGIIAAAYS